MHGVAARRVAALIGGHERGTRAASGARQDFTMSFIELKIQVNKTQAEALDELLMEFGSLAVTLEDAEDQPILEPGPGETPLWQQIVLTALFDSDIDREATLAAIQADEAWPAGAHARFQAVPDQDWVRAWMDRFQPMPFGTKLWVCPSWRPIPAEAKVPLLLDPGLAFGTGTHSTTRLCLEWLDSADLSGKHVLDFGCGSGILAIAAGKLGAAKLTALDNDPQALIATRENAERNGIAADQIDIQLPPLAEGFHCDVILANILAEPLRQLAPLFATVLKPGGALVLSGLLAEQADELLARYQPWFDSLAVSQHEDWIRIDGKRNFTDVT